MADAAPRGAGVDTRIVPVTADRPERLEIVRTLLREYAAALGVDLCFQGFEGELAALPGDYAEPGGALLLAFVDDTPAGCGALRALPDADYPNACEMKRLYVRRAFRGFGYSTMLLDTLDDMETARGLYESLGFVEVPPYYYNPIAGAHYLKAELDWPSTRG